MGKKKNMQVEIKTTGKSIFLTDENTNSNSDISVRIDDCFDEVVSLVDLVCAVIAFDAKRKHYEDKTKMII